MQIFLLKHMLVVEVTCILFDAHKMQC